MDFEYDPEKSASNKIKHGIDFEEAKRLFDDPDLLVIEATTSGERRYMAIGRLHARHWTAIFTPRGSKIRLISVRRSRRSEVGNYESA
ncbi:BrnT family toxin [Jiella avicenniae]|uniref:BrnT family toxin n=1 Tax=Jiella avicenniae TaxID=2907202 RepID=A0A9X1T7S5_9HYPH|nr:BrnT family toxin [Jiella avicenniae]